MQPQCSPSQRGGNAMAVYLEKVPSHGCKRAASNRRGRYSFAHGRRDHKYAHANVSAASPLLNRHIDAHHPQQWVMLKARTHRPTVSKNYKAKLPLSSPQDV
jgi:hypothetical protein